MNDRPKTSIRNAAAAAFLLVACAAVPLVLLAWGRVDAQEAPTGQPPSDTEVLPLETAHWDVALSRDDGEFLMGVFFDGLAASQPEGEPPAAAPEPPAALSAPNRAPVFVTAYMPGTRPIRAARREPELVESVRKAAGQIGEQASGLDPSKLRVRIDVLTSIAPLPAEERPAFLARGFGKPVGLALRRKGAPVFFLPAEIADFRAQDRESMAALLCREAKLDPQAALSDSVHLWRLEAMGFVNAAPGSRYALQSDRGLTPIGEPNLARLLRAAGSAADYLVRVQNAKGAFLTYWDAASGLKGGCDSLPEQAGAAAALGVFCGLRPMHEYASADYSAVSYAMGFTETDSKRTDMAFTRRQEVCHVVWELEATAGVLEAVCRFRRATGRTDVDAWIAALSEFLLFMQREDGLCYVKFDPESRERTTPAAGKSIVPQAKAAVALCLAHEELQVPRYLVGARRIVDALTAEGAPEAGYTSAEARWLVSALLEVSRFDDSDSLRTEAARIAEGRRAVQLLATDAPAPDLVGGSLGAFPPAAGPTADDLIVYASAAEMEAGDTAANLAAARRAAGYLMRLQFLIENSYYLSDPAAGRGGVREQPGSNIVRVQTMEAALRGLTMLAEIEMRSRSGD